MADLREYMRALDLKRPPRCWYCGDPATTLDHVRPRGARPVSVKRLRPACRRCNSRKGRLTVAQFRRRLVKIATLQGMTLHVVFFGEGPTTVGLRRLRKILATATLTRAGKVRTVPAGQPLAKPRTDVQRGLDKARERWQGRFTFVGYKALRALIGEVPGCSFTVGERFILGLPVLRKKELAAAARRLKLDVKALRKLRPSSLHVPVDRSNFGIAP